jgi:hypothetical protein
MKTSERAWRIGRDFAGVRGLSAQDGPVVTDDAGTHDVPIAGIEVFRVVDGAVTAVYNCGYKQGFWR